jgi:hypothetical protein
MDRRAVSRDVAAAGRFIYTDALEEEMEKAKLHKATATISEYLENVDASVEPTTFHFSPLYSGGPLYIDGWDDPVYIDLTTLKIDPAPKALVEHDWDAVVGKLTNIRVVETQATNGSEDSTRARKREPGSNAGALALSCDAVVGGNRLAARVVEALAVADWVSSIGVYRLEEDKIERLEKGKTGKVNGRDVSGPCYIARTGCLCEGSFVLCGGDSEAPGSSYRSILYFRFPLGRLPNTRRKEIEKNNEQEKQTRQTREKIGSDRGDVSGGATDERHVATVASVSSARNDASRVERKDALVDPPAGARGV